MGKYHEKRKLPRECINPECKKIFVSSHTSNFCYQCWVKKNPESYSRHLLRSRNARRRKKNIPLELPNLRPKRVDGIDHEGYRKIYRSNHPNARKDGIIFEHILIMSNFIGRPLKKGEFVHHKNGIRHDNRIENLELWNKYHPAGQRIEDIVYDYCQRNNLKLCKKKKIIKSNPNQLLLFT